MPDTPPRDPAADLQLCQHENAHLREFLRRAIRLLDTSDPAAAAELRAQLAAQQINLD